jgi:nicotinamide mononucleotide transporter
MSNILQAILDGLLQTGWVEAIAVIAGIVSVWYSRKENILVYPTGLINTTFYIYLSYKGHLLGEASVNLYYTIMSVYGWYLWTRKKEDHKTLALEITSSTQKEWLQQIRFFSLFYIVIFVSLSYAKTAFAPEAIPWADALASATAYTGMWLMAKKKVESWIWWILTNITSIPLYFIKGYAFTSVQFVVLLILAIAGLQSWRQKSKNGETIITKRAR